MFKIKIKKILLSLFILSAIFSAGLFALDADAAGLENTLWNSTGGKQEFVDSTGFGESSPVDVALFLLKLFLGFLGLIAVSMIIFGGFKWMTAAGDAQKLEDAKKIIIGAVIGLVIALSAFAITQYVINIMGNATGATTPPSSVPVCSPACGPTEYCCFTGCQATPCSVATPSGASLFYVYKTNPYHLETNVFRNVVVKAALSKNLGAVTIDTGNFGNFKVEKIADIDPTTGAETSISPPVLISGTATSSGSTVSFKPDAACGAPSTVTNCFDGFAKFKLTIDGNSTLISNAGIGMTCNATYSCTFEFSTSNSIDDGNPIITSLSPAGGFCKSSAGVPTNTACLSTSNCSSLGAGYACDSTTANGATGNFVTIGGINFGSSVGSVSFLNGGTWVPAVLADNVTQGNPLCASNVWNDNQAIAVVPSGLALPVSSSTIKITSAGGFEETTQDERGLKFNFLVNSINRPGVCGLNPTNGQLGDTITYNGVKLTASLAYFGSLTSKVAGGVSAFNSPGKTGMANVPNITTGTTTTFVLNASTTSNFVNFHKDEEPYTGPYITSFDPDNGAPGQYVTIMGGGFGNSKGLSEVYFGTATSSYSFPDICANSVWKDNQVIVKVPDSLSAGSYTINMVVGGLSADTSGLNPSVFNVSGTDPDPGLCKISPTMGQNNTDISLWGEYFGTTKSMVRFSLNKNASNTDIGYWGPDSSVTTGIKPDKATATIHGQAVTGPVTAVNTSGGESNGMNLKIGTCVTNDDCGGSPNACCPSSSVKAGRCEVSYDSCFSTVPSSVFEWDFSTGAGTSTGSGSATSSCAGYSLTACNNAYMCPNSPGQCSPYSAGASSIVGACSDSSCDSICGAGVCEYDSNINKCVKSGAVCNLASTTKDIFGKDITATCVGTHWQITTGASCPSPYVSIGGGKCQDNTSTCTVCDSGYQCAKSGATGVCAKGSAICPSGSTCNASNQCIKTKDSSCECCCRIDPIYEDQDCCASLTCEGTCGNDTTDDGAGFGMCTGCTTKVAGVVDYSASDAKCNCTGTSGKFCDVTGAGGKGVCVDCAQAADKTDCSVHSTVCCADAIKGDSCRALEPLTTSVPINGFAYCPYYECLSSGICAGGAVASSTSGGKLFPSPVKCTDGCVAQPNFGSVCVVNTTSTPACDSSVCKGYSCITGTSSPADISCGTCCCDPAATPDQCTAQNSKLFCKPNQTPCDSVTNTRGLCCGCESDSDCPGGGSINGCGTGACCHARPYVASTSPADGAYNVCRNLMITADFNEAMDNNSFKANVLLIGDYGTGVCPAGTTYITMDNKPAGPWAVRVADLIIKKLARVPILNKILFGDDAYAVAGINYCSIPGTADGIFLSSGFSEMVYKPAKLLDADKKYYVIIKGDTDPSDSVKVGVLNSFGVGMNDPAGATDSFNGITYAGAKIWSFTTMADTGGTGACKMDSVSVSPSSYLFQTLDDDLKEIDNDPSDSSFDSAKDKDKVFVAEALSADGQLLNPLSGIYDWTWSWGSSNGGVVSLSNITGFSEKTFAEAQTGVVDGQSVLTATADISDGTTKSGSADAYVFICKNPWPAINAGIWNPWLDTDTNQKIYYCRDAGKPGTADDLPAISNNGVILGPNAIALKEAYFPREDVPQAASGTSVSFYAISNDITGIGGAVTVAWPSVVGVGKYKLYWGTSQGSFPYPSSTSTTATNYTVAGLQNNKTYYFAVTSLSSAGAESAPSKIVSAIPADTTLPPAPTGISASSTSAGAAVISWDDKASTDKDTVKYNVYYGVTSNVYGAMPKTTSLNSINVSGLSGNTLYYFGVVALDASGNPSSTSTVSILVK